MSSKIYLRNPFGNHETTMTPGKISSIKLDPSEPDKSYGYVLPVGSKKGCFFMAGDVKGADIATLQIGDTVKFEMVDGNRISMLVKDNGPQEYAATTSAGAIATSSPEAPSSKPEAPTQPKATESPSSGTSCPSVTPAQLVDDLVKTLDAIPGLSESTKFEDAVFVLLKVLGINNVYQYDRKDQAGKADGFFTCQNLAVLYDCTLREDFFDFKEEQIDNYVSKLSKSSLTMNARKSDGGKLPRKFPLNEKVRQVWIITAKKTREIMQSDSIRVKEVAVQDLIKLLRRRLHADSFDAEQLASELARIENL